MSGVDRTMIGTVDVTTVAPIARPEAETLARTEVARLVDAIRALDPEDWDKPTANELWDVRAMLGHVLGMTEAFTGLRAMASGMAAGSKRAKADGTPQIDGITAVQVERTAGLTTDALIDRLAAAGPKAARWRASRRLMRRIPLAEEVGGEPEKWTVGYLVDVILTRDTWMHRSDLAAATGKSMTLTDDHDGRIVADVVAEWARRHGEPFALSLTGPAGGEFVSGSGGEELELDAVEFCRILSGRGAGDGLLRTEVPF